MNFHVDQRVVCIANNDKWHGRSEDLKIDHVHLPRFNAVYTIRELVEGGAGVLLKEIVNRPKFFRDEENGELYGMEISFGIENFRPLDDKRIEVFRSMLNTPPKKVDA